MKKLLPILAALCLMCAAAVSLAEAPAFDAMPAVVTLDEGTELTGADFEGDWVVDKVFIDTTYLTPEEVKTNGLEIHPFRIADGKITYFFTDGQGDHEVSVEYTLESNQILGTDDDGVEFVIEKLEDGNIVMSIFIPCEDETMSCVSFFMVHP